MSPLRRLIWPSIGALVMFAVLVGLGTWQMRRLAWKEALLADIARAEAQAAVPYGEGAALFSKVQMEGRFRPDIVALYGSEGRTTRTGPVLGAHLLGVLEREGGLPVIIDRGWVPQTMRTPPPDGRITLEGWLRPGESPGMFAATDNAADRRFYTLDPAAIGRALGVGEVAPFVLVVLGRPSGWDQPEPALVLPRPKNDHLTYAMTWYSLAAVLVVVFLLFARKLLRAP